MSIVLILFYGESRLYFLALTILCILFCTMDIIMYKSIKKVLQTRLLEAQLNSASKQLKTQASYYNELMDEVYKYRKLRHDQLNYLNTLLSLLNMKKIDELKELLQSIVGKAASLTTGYCSNLVVDSILTANKTIADEYDIEYVIDVILEDDVGIDQIDLCSVFSNILDNAVTACKDVNNDRLIMLSAAVKSGCLIIRSKNTKRNEIKLRHDNKLLSSKGSDPEHGLGLTILDDIARKYDGSMRINHDKEYFQITVFLMCGADSTAPLEKK